MYDSGKNRRDFQVRIILCPSPSSSSPGTSTVDNYRTNGGLDGSSSSKVGELGKKRSVGGGVLSKSLRRIIISRKRRKKLSAILASKKPMSSLLAAQLATSSSSEASSPTSQGERTLRVLVVDEEEMNPSSATISHGLISVIGRRRSMEDAVTVAPRLVHVSSSTDLEEAATSRTFDFFAVYDGHGGKAVANRCKERMHNLVAAEITADMDRAAATSESQGQVEVDWDGVMGRSFARMDEEVAAEAGDDGAVKAAVGSTALVVVVGKEEVVVANCGDCRAVLGVSGGASLPLSRDHKPERPDEKERVEAAGGNVVNWDCSRVLGVLATSRSIGDYYLKPYVIAEPEVIVHKRTVSDEFLILASDGLWDVVPNELACELVSKCLRGQVRKNVYEEFSGNSAAAAATVLAELALARGSRDNISVIVVELQRSSSSSTSTSAASSP